MAHKDDAGKSGEAESKYKGVRKRKWGKWVSEIRLPHSRKRIWLGSYDSAEKAARAFDAAQFCLRGPSTKFNFPDDPPNIAGGQSMTQSEIQLAASRYANGGASSSTTSMEVPEEAPASRSRSMSDGTPSPPLGTYPMHDYDITSPSPPLGTYPMHDYDITSYQSNLDHLSAVGSGNYTTDFELMSGFMDYSGVPQTPNSDNDNDDSGGRSFLWNF